MDASRGRFAGVRMIWYAPLLTESAGARSRGTDMKRFAAVFSAVCGLALVQGCSSDDDNGGYQNNLTTGHEVYLKGKDPNWFLLTPGEDGRPRVATPDPASASSASTWPW